MDREESIGGRGALLWRIAVLYLPLAGLLPAVPKVSIAQAFVLLVAAFILVLLSRFPPRHPVLRGLPFVLIAFLVGTGISGIVSVPSRVGAST